MTFLNEHASAFYGILTLIAVALAGLSGRHVLIKFALILLMDWAVYNVLIEVNGYAHSPMLIPTFDAAIGVWFGSLAWANRSLIGAAVFALFVAVVGWWWIEIGRHMQGSYECYLGANLIFLSQVLIVGGSGGWAFVADRLAGSQLRPRYRLARG